MKQFALILISVLYLTSVFCDGQQEFTQEQQDTYEKCLKACRGEMCPTVCQKQVQNQLSPEEIQKRIQESQNMFSGSSIYQEYTYDESMDYQKKFQEYINSEEFQQQQQLWQQDASSQYQQLPQTPPEYQYQEGFFNIQQDGQQVNQDNTHNLRRSMQSEPKRPQQNWGQNSNQQPKKRGGPDQVQQNSEEHQQWVSQGKKAGQQDLTNPKFQENVKCMRVYKKIAHLCIGGQDEDAKKECFVSEINKTDCKDYLCQNQIKGRNMPFCD